MATTKLTKKPKHYVDNQKFLEALVDYRSRCALAKADSRDDPPIPEYIGECFYKISENLSHIHKFISYSFREEMVGDGIENCIMYFRNYDAAKGTNPFAYFTQIVYYAFLRRIAKEKKQLYVKYKATQQFGILDEGEMYEDENGNMKQFEMYDNISEFIQTYEDKKKEKKKVKTKGLDNFIEIEIDYTDNVKEN